jgi:hypothetical protein
MLIKNNGGEIKITTSPNQENTTKQEKTITKELVSIKNNDINVLTDTKMFTNFLTRNNISETLSLTTQPQTLLPNTNEENTSLASNTSAPSRQTSSGETATGNFPERSQIFESTTGQQTNDTINEEIKSDLGLGHETKIPTPTQNELLKTTVNSFFLTNNFEKIYNSLLENDETKLKENSKNLATKLNALAKSFAIETSTSTELTDLASFALEIKTTLETIYYIAPSDLSQLEKIAHRCEYLTNLSPETALSRSDFTNQLPASLQLK